MKNIYVTILVIALFAMSGMKVPTLELIVGPAPNSGDGVSDGSGLDSPFYNGLPDVDSPGPAPNSGDGIPDGSGF